MATPLTMSANEAVALIQCVTRTTRLCRGIGVRMPNHYPVSAGRQRGNLVGDTMHALWCWEVTSWPFDSAYSHSCFSLCL